MGLKLLMSKFNKLTVSLRDKRFFGAYIFFRNFCRPKTYPSSVKIEITTKCNLRCVMCVHGSPDFGSWKDANANMSFEKFKLAIDNFHGLKWVNFVGAGENFINEDFMKMIRYAKSKNILVGFSSNFFLIDKKIAEELIETGVNRIFISIDGSNKKTYEKIRVGSDFEKVIDNVKTIFRLKKELNGRFLEIYFYYVVSKYNIDEIVKYVEMVHSLRGGEKTMITFINMSDSFIKKDILDSKVSKDLIVPEEIIQEVNIKSKKLDIPVVWLEDIFKNKPSINNCTYYLDPFISINGEVFPCCCFLGFKSLQKEMIFGNIFERNFKKIWQSEKYNNFRKLLYEGKTPSFCKDCRRFDVDRY